MTNLKIVKALFFAAAFIGIVLATSIVIANVHPNATLTNVTQKQSASLMGDPVGGGFPQTSITLTGDPVDGGFPQTIPIPMGDPVGGGFPQ